MDNIGAKSGRDDLWPIKPHRENPHLSSSHNLSLHMNMVAAQASGAVVCIVSHLDGENIFRGSGFVVESTLVDNEYTNTIFTSANLLRHKKNVDVVSDIEISIILSERITHRGELVAYDFHYNIAALKVKTQMPIPSSKLKHIDDSISLDPKMLDEEPEPYDNHDRFHLFPGDTIVALGRYSFDKIGFMIVAGVYSITKPRLDCENLLRAECEIKTHCTGGPVMNRYGEVIGISFFADNYTPFLPINIVLLWWENIKKSGHCDIPQHGMKLGNICRYPSGYLELVMRKFPNTFKGVVVDEVILDALKSKIFRGDIVVKCNGETVGSILEFLELIWDKVGRPVQLTVLRPCDGSHLSVTVIVGSVGSNQFNSWPQPPKCRPCKRSYLGL